MQASHCSRGCRQAHGHGQVALVATLGSLHEPEAPGFTTRWLCNTTPHPPTSIHKTPPPSGAPLDTSRPPLGSAHRTAPAAAALGPPPSARREHSARARASTEQV